MRTLEITITEMKQRGPWELKVSGDRRLRTVKPTLEDAIFLAQRCLDEFEEAEEIKLS